MEWFTGSSTEGLPHIHDSFPLKPKAVHRRPKPPRPPPSPEHNQPATRTASTQDIGTELLESEFFRLPPVDSGQLTSRSLDGGERGKDPTSFTSYMHRYKACARLKGITTSRVYCSTRMRSTPSQDDLDLSPSRLPHRDPLPTSRVPTSNPHRDRETDPAKTDPFKTTAKIDPNKTDANKTDTNKTDPNKTDPNKTDPTKTDTNKTDTVSGGTEADGVPAELPHLTPPRATDVKGPPDCSVLEKQIEEKLEKDKAQDDGMTHVKQQHSVRATRGRRRRKGGGGRGVSRVQGGGRPLGDIVSPHRLQELLREEDARTLPHIYYRTSLDGQDSSLQDVGMESPP
ncbi:uncharacterized protein LOC143293168 [Babylonia areolata]|uniref:uncharacterized protein LOC143293168 n=1 Tax=Babylonia areolata TaxID=304850 RepID=UPI003FD448E6